MRRLPSATPNGSSTKRTARKEALAALTALLLFGLALGCATNPVTGKSELSIVSDAQELAAGKQALAAAEAEYGYYDDAQWTARVNTMGQKLAQVSHRPSLAWQFHIADDPTVNAFAAPAGFIFVTRGIIATLNSEAQLAGVIGHEIGHVTAKHYSQQATREQLTGLGIGVASIFSSTLAQYGQIAQQGLGILFLKYSRDQENEADALGVTYSVKAGWDAREMPATYHTLARIGAAAGSSTPTYLSTHPDPAAREATTRQLAATAVGTRTDLIVNHDSYIRSLEGLVYGNDPRQGYFEADRYYHPALAFTIDFPAGWLHQDSRSAILAANKAKTAVMQVTVVNTGGTPASYVQKLQAGGQITGAEGSSEQVGGFPAWVGRVQVQDEQGQKAVLAYALVQQTAQQTFQFLGQMQQAGGADEQAILTAARSFRALTDPARKNPTPARIKIVAAPSAGTFASIAPGLGTQSLSLEESAILNGVATGDPIARGQLLKIVTPARVK
jgi:predicted Zn-dependent protease